MSSSPVPPASSACTSRARCSMRGARCHRRRQFRSVLRRGAEGGARRRARGATRASRSSTSISPTRPRAQRCFAQARSRASSTSPRSRACAIRSSIRTRTCATTSSRSATCSKRCRHCRDRASRLCVVVVASTAPITTLPFSEDQPVDHPVSLYAATKKANELMAHSYSHLFGLPTTGLRFFTVYGPWGRPDQAPMLFTKAIVEGRPIDVFNAARWQRDFTYIDDIVEGVAADHSRVRRGATRRHAPYAIYNIGNHDGGDARRVHRDARSVCSAAARCATSGRCSRATSRRRTRRSSACSRHRFRADARRSPTDSRASSTGTAATIRRLELRASRCWGARIVAMLNSPPSSR